MLLALLLAALPAVAQTPDVPPDLRNYLRADDGAFKWALADTAKGTDATVYTLDLTSQTWHGHVWTHKLLVFAPAGKPAKGTMLLYNTGGSPKPQDLVAGKLIAQKVGSPVAYLFGVPKQPLYGKVEDALIAETFVRFLDTKDGTWPLLFPMAKSVVRAMDALQAFAREHLQAEVTGFVVTGASKRGWTSWLTAASGDGRVKAIAPMVIDTLNMARQMPHQFASFGGKYSEQIRDYEARGLLPLPDTDDARRLWRLVDPWTYRASLTLPKLLIHGTNDPYWAQDATNIYWDDLPGPKYLCYVPNAGHDLRAMADPAARTGKEPIPTQAVNTLAAFARSVIDGTPFPKPEWVLETDPDMGRPAVRLKSDVPPKAIRGWTAESATRDFRRAKWTQVKQNSVLINAASLTLGNTGYTAGFLEAEYDLGTGPFSLTTQIRIAEPANK